MNAAGAARDACADRPLSSISFDVPMTVKRLTFCAVLFLLFVLGVTWFWRQLFDTRAPSLRDQVQGENVHIYGESPQHDAAVNRAWLEEAKRGNVDAQYTMGLIMEQSDRKEALRWYEAAAAQGYPAAIERLQQLRARPAQR